MIWWLKCVFLHVLGCSDSVWSSVIRHTDHFFIPVCVSQGIGSQYNPAQMVRGLIRAMNNLYMNVTSSYSTRIFYRGVSGFATGCTCGVWCRGLTTCLLYVGPLFRNRPLNNRSVEGLTYWIVNLLILGSLLAISLTKPITQWLSSKHKQSQSIHTTDLLMKTNYKDQISPILSNEKETYIT